VDWLDLLWNACIGCTLGLPLWALAAIALRVACHWSGLEIPAFGRAMIIILASTAPAVAVGWLLQILFIGWDGSGFHPVLQFLVLAITLFLNAAISAALYSKLLHARFAQAMSVWLVSTILFVIAAGCFACAIGVPVQIIRQGF
jgi:hypothetical protein